jgi:hypothetical protein
MIDAAGHPHNHVTDRGTYLPSIHHALSLLFALGEFSLLRRHIPFAASVNQTFDVT